MNNSKRSVIFTVAFIVVMFVFSFVMPQFDAFFSDTFRFINGVLFLILILYPALQMLMRWVYTDRHLKKDHTFYTLKVKDNMTYYRLINILFVGLLLGFPIVKGLLTPDQRTTYLLGAMVWLIITEALIQISSRSLKAYFGHGQLIVKGFDFRLDLPFGDAIKSHSGVYEYRNITVFTYKDGLLTLHLYDNAGKINILLHEDVSKQVMAYLGTKKIQHKEFYRV
ncbi:MAG: hypothetical protein JXO44_08000 [Clostridia bacterium]|nr:hypothetical protein [Clostridia bacterium]